MKGNRARDTQPELRIRSALHRRGWRYRVNIRPLQDVRRTADLVFPGRKVAVFVDGCFWHGCPEHYRPSSAHSEFWRAKLAANLERDDDTNARLREAGWTVIRIWEHEATTEAVRRVEATLRGDLTQP